MSSKIFKVISQVMGVSEEEISEESSPDTIEAWDSLNHMNLVFALEEEYGITFTDESIMQMIDVSSIIKTINDSTPAADNNA